MESVLGFFFAATLSAILIILVPALGAEFDLHEPGDKRPVLKMTIGMIIFELFLGLVLYILNPNFFNV